MYNSNSISLLVFLDQWLRKNTIQIYLIRKVVWEQNYADFFFMWMRTHFILSILHECFMIFQMGINKLDYCIKVETTQVYIQRIFIATMDPSLAPLRLTVPLFGGPLYLSAFPPHPSPQLPSVYLPPHRVPYSPANTTQMYPLLPPPSHFSVFPFSLPPLVYPSPPPHSSLTPSKALSLPNLRE